MIHPSQQRCTEIRDGFELKIWTVGERKTGGFSKPNIVEKRTCSVDYEGTYDKRDALRDGQHNISGSQLGTSIPKHSKDKSSD